MGWWRAWGRSPLAPGCQNLSDVPPNGHRISDWSGQPEQYEVSYASATWYLKVAGVTKYTVWDGHICWPNIGVAWFGESVNRGAAIGGSFVNRHEVTANRYRVTGSSTWYTPAWSFPGNYQTEFPKPPYYCKKIAGDELEMWSDH
jgi:hypothetical protein